MDIAHDSLWHISDFMDYNTLINARQTCKMWNQLITLTKLKNRFNYELENAKRDFVCRFCDRFEFIKNSTDFTPDIMVMVQSEIHNYIVISLKDSDNGLIYITRDTVYSTNPFWKQMEEYIPNKFEKNDFYIFLRNTIIKLWKNTKDDSDWWKLTRHILMPTMNYQFNKSFSSLKNFIKQSQFTKIEK